MVDISTLPDSVNDLKALIHKLNDEALLEIKSRDQKIQLLEDKISILQRDNYAPKSEKVPSNQLGLFNEAEELVTQENEEGAVEENEETEEITYKRRKKKRPRIPDSLPREEVILDLPGDQKSCPHDGTPLVKIGEEISERLEFIPAKFSVKKIIRVKYGCPCCSEGVHTLPPPPALIPKSILTPNLMAAILVSKYADGLPLYRQEEIFKRYGIEISRQTMARWVIEVSLKTLPLYNLLQDITLSSDYLQMDETKVQVLKEKGKKPTTLSYLWVRYRPGENPIVLYHYSPTRSGSVPLELLPDFKGYLQTDGYEGYSGICSKPGITRLGCADHSRRKFEKAFKTSSGKGIGKKAIIYFKKIYRPLKDLK